MKHIKIYIEQLIKIQQDSIDRYEDMTSPSPAMDAYIQNQIRNKEEQIAMLETIINIIEDETRKAI